ncbi:hypothetical protein GmHk_14G041750 [Glycine max]|nr:hypothetical protein GmHk_14G041750 [Glycine max]
MADHATRKTTINHLEDAILRLTIHHDFLSKKHSDLAHKVDTILDYLDQLTHLQPSPSPSPSPTRHQVKLEISRFNGHDPLGWIFKASQFFNY